MVKPQKTLVVDIDGTLCPVKQAHEHYEDLVPFDQMIQQLLVYRKNGFRIILQTARNMRTYNGNLELIHSHTAPLLEKWLKDWNIPYDEIVFGKPWAGDIGFYIDDRAIRPNEFLSKSLAELEALIENSRVNHAVL